MAWTTVGAVEVVVMYDWVIRNLKLSDQIVVEYRKAVDRARDGDGDGAELGGQRPPKHAVEHPPEALGDGPQQRGGRQHGRDDAERPADLEPAQLPPQVVSLGDGHQGAGRRGADNRPRGVSVPTTPFHSGCNDGSPRELAAPLEVARPAFNRRIAGIEGLRGIAAASVLITHVWNQSQSKDAAFELGFLSDYVLPAFHHGVILFFALSGFLLWLPFAAALLRGKEPPSIRAYARNRFLRIAPAYWVILLLSALVLQSTRTVAGERTTGALTNPRLLVENLLLVQNYDGVGTGTGIAAAWSLSVELSFYALLPVFALIAIRPLRGAASRSRMRLHLLAPGVLLGMFGLAASFFGPGQGSDVAWLDRWEVGFPTHAHLFALGMLLAVLLAEVQDGHLRLPRRWRPAAIGSLAVSGLGTVWLAAGDRVPERIEVCLVAVCCALLLALTVLGLAERSPLVRFLEAPALVWAGLVSYSVYLWHLPVIGWLQDRGATGEETGLAFAWNLFLVAVVTGLLSYLTYRFVERPALAHKKASHASRRRTPTNEPANVAGSRTHAIIRDTG